MNRLPISMMKVAKNKSALKEGFIQIGKLDTENIYLYDITNFMIGQVGRFCESYATDFLISWDSFIKHVKEDEEGIHYFGIRESGVDGDTYTFNTCKNGEVGRRYRKLYAVEFHRFHSGIGTDDIMIYYRIHDLGNYLPFNYADNDFDMNTLNENYSLSKEETLEMFPYLKDLDTYYILFKKEVA